MVRVEVHDDGNGVADVQKSSLFKPFAQAQLRAGGTGLGLAGVSTMSEVLGGHCGVGDSEELSGALFWCVPFPPRASFPSSPRCR